MPETTPQEQKEKAPGAPAGKNKKKAPDTPPPASKPKPKPAGPRRVVVDPVTRIEGHLRMELEAQDGRITNAWACTTQFRGIETVLKGRDPRDAWAYAQRICGVCTAVHAIASIRAVEDALDYHIPRSAELIRNLVSGMQNIQDHVIHFYHLHALDWVDVVSALDADPTETAKIAASISEWPNNSPTHFKEVQDRIKKSVAGGQLSIFTNGYWGHEAYKLPPEVNLLAVAHYLEALDWQRDVIRLHTIFGGKNPHPNFLVGGMACSINLDNQLTINSVTLSQLAGMIDRATRFVEQVYLPDLVAIGGFYKEYASIGIANPNFLAVAESGYSYAGMPPSDQFKPGVLLDGDYSKFVDFDLNKIAEYVTSGWYDHPEGDNQALHPWKGETTPNYTGPKPPFEWLSDQTKYTWNKAPRYDGRATQVGPNARMIVGYAQGHAGTVKIADDALGKLGVGIEALNSTLGRTLCRGLETLLLCKRMHSWFDEFIDRIESGQTHTFNPEKWEPSTWPKSAQGVGFLEAGRGTLSHWVEIEKGHIKRYQCVVPSTWNASGRDPEGQMGPYEYALASNGHHPLVDPDKPLEVLRTIHSFDPCQSCAVHLFDARRKPITQIQVQ